MHACICVCVYACVYACMYMCMCLCVCCLYKCMLYVYVCTCVLMCVHVCTCEYACACVCCVCMHVCVIAPSHTSTPTPSSSPKVLPIWEGTTNVLSLDVLRVLHKSDSEALRSFVSSVKSRVSNTRQLERRGLLPSAAALGRKVEGVLSFVSGDQGSPVMEAAARDLSYSLAHVFIGQ